MNKSFKSLPVVLALTIGLLTNHAQATALTWTFSDGATSNVESGYYAKLSGSFVYDAETNTVESVSVSMYTFNSSNVLVTPLSPNVTQFGFLFNNASKILYWNEAPPINLSSSLTSAGGTINFLNGNGSISASSPVSAVPVPAAAWLFGSGLVGLAGLRRRKQQS